MSRFDDWTPDTVKVRRPTRTELQDLIRTGRLDRETDALAATFGDDVAGDLRALGTTPAMEDWLVSLAIRRDTRKRGPVYGEDLADALRALEGAHARLRRDFPLLEFGSGIANGIERVRRRARLLGLPRKQGRPPWLKLAVDRLRALGANPTAARDMAERAGLGGPYTKNKPPQQP